MSWLRSPPPAQGSIACPRDGAPLRREPSGNVTIDVCPACAGAWYDDKELRAVVHDKELERLAQRVSAYGKPSAFACPRCAAACVRSHVHEVECDTCTSCRGVWFDAGELVEAKRELDVQRAIDAQTERTVAGLRRL